MTSEQWTDRNTGERRSKALVKVDRLALLGSKTESTAAAGPTAGAATPQGTSTATSPQVTATPPAGSQGWNGTPVSNAEVPF
jgi:single-stranded DNA-binding protein